MGMKNLVKTGERMLPERVMGLTEELMLLRHFFAYEQVKAKLDKNSVILDLGCGVGYGTYLLSQVAKNVIGIDISEEAIHYANENYGALNCQFMVYDGMHTNYYNDSFDVIVSFQVIEHVVNDIQFVSEAYRLLKPGGSFFLTTPNKIFRLFPLQKPWNKFHIREYYPYELNELLSKSFNNVEILGISGSNEIVAMENMRINKIQNDQLKLLNKLIPFTVKRKIGDFFKKLGISTSSKKVVTIEEEMLKNSSYFLVHNDVYRSLDLFAICKKN